LAGVPVFLELRLSLSAAILAGTLTRPKPQGLDSPQGGT
jgi:hypothetical protein